MAILLCGGQVCAAGSSTSQSTAKGKLNYTKKTIKQYETFQLKINGVKTKKIKISNPDVAFVVNLKKGIIKGDAAGTTKITVTGANKRKYTCKLTVKASQPKMNVERLNLKVGDTYQLKLKNYTGKVKWVSSDPEYVTVSSTGKIKVINYNRSGANYGIQIMAYYANRYGKYDNHFADCCVDIPLLPSIVMPEGRTCYNEYYSRYLMEGKSLTLSTKNLSKKYKVKWNSTNSAVASVNANGVVTAKKGGRAVIYTYLGDEYHFVNIYVQGKWKYSTDNKTRTIVMIDGTVITEHLYNVPDSDIQVWGWFVASHENAVFDQVNLTREESGKASFEWDENLYDIAREEVLKYNNISYYGRDPSYKYIPGHIPNTSVLSGILTMCQNDRLMNSLDKNVAIAAFVRDKNKSGVSA
ncbi:MAG: Ig-like domain-containing protein [Lachnospiraceae bacterium]